MKYFFTKFLPLAISLILFTPPCYATQSSQKHSTESPPRDINQELRSEFIFSPWSRDPRSCRNPELTFSNKQLIIKIDADGEPIQFTYNPITYEQHNDTITAKLGKKHPYGHTKSKESLTFDIINENTISMQTTKFEAIKLNRCKKGN